MSRAPASQPELSAVDSSPLDEFEQATPGQALRLALRRFGNRAALVTAFGAEGMVLIDLAARFAPGLRLITIDTGRLPESTYVLMEETRRRYGVSIELYFPETRAVEELSLRHGLYSFRNSIEARRECCNLRKVEPLRRALATVDCWITGLRRDQSVSRHDISRAEVDETHGNIIKLNPLAEWSDREVWAEIRKNGTPYNPLHDQGYPSIGCAPCTRPVRAGEGPRSGRWWWETAGSRECGLHLHPSQ